MKANTHIEEIIKKYNLTGKGALVMFKNDKVMYSTKNIHPNRKYIFVYDPRQNVKYKKITDIVRVGNQYLESSSRNSGGGKFEGGGTTGESRLERTKRRLQELRDLENTRMIAVGKITGRKVQQVEDGGWEFVRGDLKEGSGEFSTLVGKVTGEKARRLLGSGITIRKKMKQGGDVLPTTSLFFREGVSDKEYHIQIVKKGNGYVVNFQYGRRGSSLQTGTKTPSAVSLPEAMKVFTKLKNEKTGKGYQEQGGARNVYASSEDEDIPVQIKENVFSPQLLDEIDNPQQFIDDDNYYAQEKKDGERRPVKSTEDKIIGINKKGQAVPLIDNIKESIKSFYILDGEQVGDKLYVFDLVSFDEKSLADLPLEKRLNLLYKLKFGNSIEVVPTAYTKEEKQKLFDKVKAENGEGVVFKKKNAPYKGGRVGNQFKFKFHKTATFIVANLTKDKRSVGLELIDNNGEKVFMGKVTIPPNKEMPSVGDLVEVRYLYAYKGGAVFQPVFLGVRNDSDLTDATIKQIIYKKEMEVGGEINKKNEYEEKIKKIETNLPKIFSEPTLMVSFAQETPTDLVFGLIGGTHTISRIEGKLRTKGFRVEKTGVGGERRLYIPKTSLYRFNKGGEVSKEDLENRIKSAKTHLDESIELSESTQHKLSEIESEVRRAKGKTEFAKDELDGAPLPFGEGGEIDTPRELGTILKRYFKSNYNLDIDTRFVKTVRGLDGSWYEITTFKSGQKFPNDLRKEILEFSRGKTIDELNISSPNDISYGNIQPQTMAVYGRDWKAWLKSKNIMLTGGNVDEEEVKEVEEVKKQVNIGQKVWNKWTIKKRREYLKKIDQKIPLSLSTETYSGLPKWVKIIIKDRFTKKIEAPEVLEARWAKKKERIRELSNNVHKLKNNVTRGLSSDNEKDFLCVLIIAIMQKTGERVGNGESADNGHYGVTGFRKKHISIEGNQVTLDYVGKSGVKHEKIFTDEKIAKGLKKAIKNSPDYFVFTTSEGQKINANHVNDYLKDFSVTAKDIRGFSANAWILDKLKDIKPEDTDKKRKKQFNGVLKFVANKIGHGAATLRTHYMMPEVMTVWVDKGEVFDIKESGYATLEKGGVAEKLGISDDKAKNIFHLPYEFTIYVPSTQDVSGVISKEELRKRVDLVKKELANMFGGFSSADIEGGYVSTEKELVEEKVVKVTAFSTKEAFDKNKNALLEQISKWSKEWGQESIGLEFEGDLMYVPQKLAKGGEVKEKIKLVVVDENILGYILPNSNNIGILHASILKGDTRSNMSGFFPRPINDEGVRLATPKDFDDFRVSMDGYKNGDYIWDDRKSHGGSIGKTFKVEVVGKELEKDGGHKHRWVYEVKADNESEAEKLSEQQFNKGWALSDIGFYSAKVIKNPTEKDVPKKLGEKVYADGGEVQFIEHKGVEIMYEPNYNEYFVSDNQFATLEKAKKFIDDGSMESGGKIVFSVRYEKEVDGEYDNFTKTFDDKKKAVAFAAEKYSSVDYEETIDGKIINSGFVNTNEESPEYLKLISYKMAKGGITNIRLGDSVHVKSLNKSGVVMNVVLNLPLPYMVTFVDGKSMVFEIKDLELIKSQEDFEDEFMEDVTHTQSLIDAYMGVGDKGKRKQFKIADKSIQNLVDKHPSRQEVLDMLLNNTSLVSLALINKYKKTIELEQGGEIYNKIVFTKKVNPQMKIIVHLRNDGRISKIEKTPTIIMFPYKVGQLLTRNAEVWASNNNWLMDGKDMSPEEKIFGIPVSQVPQGHEWRLIYPSKFRKMKSGGEIITSDGSQGGMAEGPAHSEGGIETDVIGSHKVEIEGFEPILVPEVNNIRDKVVCRGTPKGIASAVNEISGGNKFANEGSCEYIGEKSETGKKLSEISPRKNEKEKPIVKISPKNGKIKVRPGSMIINKKNMAIKDIMECEGKPVGIVSAINEHEGNGVKFADNGRCRIIKKRK